MEGLRSNMLRPEAENHGSSLFKNIEDFTKTCTARNIQREDIVEKKEDERIIQQMEAYFKKYLGNNVPAQLHTQISCKVFLFFFFFFFSFKKKKKKNETCSEN